MIHRAAESTSRGYVHDEVHARLLLRRTASVAIDIVTFGAAWWVAFFVILNLLMLRDPNEPWGTVAVAIVAGFVTAALGLSAFEAKLGCTMGRSCAGLRVTTRDGSTVSGGRRHVRAITKLGVLASLVWLGLELDASLGLPGVALPFIVYALANGATAWIRGDGRSIVDLLVGTRSTVAC